MRPSDYSIVISLCVNKITPPSFHLFAGRQRIGAKRNSTSLEPLTGSSAGQALVAGVAGQAARKPCAHQHPHRPRAVAEAVRVLPSLIVRNGLGGRRGKRHVTAGWPQVVGDPATLNWSFTVTGGPSSGRRSPRPKAQSGTAGRLEQVPLMGATMDENRLSGIKANAYPSGRHPGFILCGRDDRDLPFLR
jgi:hypothetical protein